MLSPGGSPVRLEVGFEVAPYAAHTAAELAGIGILPLCDGVGAAIPIDERTGGTTIGCGRRYAATGSASIGLQADDKIVLVGEP